MTEERRQKLLQSSQGPGAEPFSQYNHMKVTAVDDGTATVELEPQPQSSRGRKSRSGSAPVPFIWWSMRPPRLGLAGMAEAAGLRSRTAMDDYR